MLGHNILNISSPDMEHLSGCSLILLANFNVYLHKSLCRPFSSWSYHLTYISIHTKLSHRSAFVQLFYRAVAFQHILLISISDDELDAKA